MRQNSLLNYYFAVLSLIVILNVTLEAQTEPCKEPEASQLDFWLGSWDMSWIDQGGVESVGSNTITKILGSCVIEENFESGDKSYLGRSLSVYNAAKKMWQQTWVDNAGDYLEFSGGMHGENMVLSRKGKNRKGIEVTQRMVFSDITKNEFNWKWESSPDDGKTWNTMIDIKYKRKQ